MFNFIIKILTIIEGKFKYLEAKLKYQETHWENKAKESIINLKKYLREVETRKSKTKKEFQQAINFAKKGQKEESLKILRQWKQERKLNK
ncbi:MAG TPA: hypothetical protein DCX95_07820 [Elusimicrobia bacterium]|nr:hypothetical protein [Elusimicrobiota bacterium]